ncbi:MAG: monothiol bacilliredoxin BrxC family protein, partial [Ginsengibacter sp.]
MNWIPLQDEKQLNEIVSNSVNNPQVIFKHSTRCSISSMAKNKLDKKESPEGINFYLLDLIRFRSLSNKIANDFGI